MWIFAKWPLCYQYLIRKHLWISWNLWQIVVYPEPCYHNQSSQQSTQVIFFASELGGQDWLNAFENQLKNFQILPQQASLTTQWLTQEQLCVHLCWKTRKDQQTDLNMWENISVIKSVVDVRLDHTKINAYFVLFAGPWYVQKTCWWTTHWIQQLSVSSHAKQSSISNKCLEIIWLHWHKQGPTKWGTIIMVQAEEEIKI